MITKNGKIAVTPFPPLSENVRGTYFHQNAQRVELVVLSVVFDSDSGFKAGHQVVVRGDSRAHSKDVYKLGDKLFFLLDEKLVVAAAGAEEELKFVDPDAEKRAADAAAKEAAAKAKQP